MVEDNYVRADGEQTRGRMKIDYANISMLEKHSLIEDIGDQAVE